MGVCKVDEISRQFSTVYDYCRREGRKTIRHDSREITIIIRNRADHAVPTLSSKPKVDHGIIIVDVSQLRYNQC